MASPIFARLLLAAVFTCGAISLARAQETPTPTPAEPTSTATSRRVYRGLFGGASAVDDRKQSLDLTLSLFGAYVEELSGDTVPSGTNLQTVRESTYYGGNAGLRYSRQWDAATVAAFAGGGLAYVPENGSNSEDSWLDRWNAGATAGYAKPLGRRTSFRASGSTIYSPYYQFGGALFSPGTVVGPAPVPGLDYVVARDPSISWAGTAVLSRDLSRRGTLDFFYAIQGTQFLSDEAARNDRLTQAAGVRYRFRLNRFASLRAGYAYRVSNISTGQLAQHEFDVGLDGNYGLSRSYAISSRTTVSFQVTPRVFVGELYRIQEDTADDQQTVSDPTLRLYIGGMADLLQTWGRTWAARAAYVRSAGYEIDFDRPVQRDSAIASVGGFLTTRIDFSATAAVTSGAVGFSGADRGFGTTTATASIRAAMTRLLAAYAQYFYYKYDFDEGIRLPSDLSRQRERQGASVGISLWLPLL